MDTPQVTRGLLRSIADRVSAAPVHAVLGLAHDGGWWALAHRDPSLVAGLTLVPMSTPETGAATYELLTCNGATVSLAPRLRDVDEPSDAMLVAAAAPQTRFAAVWRSLTAGAELEPTQVFTDALLGSPCVLHGLPEGPVTVPVDRWQREADVNDQFALAECLGPTLDVGCGPGRLTQALASQGATVLGIDLVPEAVRQTIAGGGQALARDVFGPIPGEGRWGTILLLDGNIGICGDPVSLLRRAHQLLAPAGQVVVEVAPPTSGAGAYDVRLETAGKRSTAFRWARVSAEQVADLGNQAALRLLWLVERNGRWFARLEKALT